MPNHKEPRRGQRIGHISGSAKVTIPMESHPVEYDPSADPADVYANFVRFQVHQLMEQHHCLPTEITVALSYDED